MASREAYASIVHNGYNILWTASVLLGLTSREALANPETEKGEKGEEEEEEEAAADSVASSPSMVVGDFRPPKRKLALQLPEDEDRVTGSALSAQSRESQHCARLCHLQFPRFTLHSQLRVTAYVLNLCMCLYVFFLHGCGCYCVVDSADRANN